jgi:DUF971 family protein
MMHAGGGEFAMVDASESEAAGAIPVELRRMAGGGALGLVWPDGRAAALDAARLRCACRCADCVRRRASGSPWQPPATLAVTALDPVGHYAIAISFSDGHARGIYPWSYLRSLAEEAAASN